MPFKSEAQRRKFYALKAQGKMDQKTIDEWNKDTPKNLPQKLHKQASDDIIIKIASTLTTEQLLTLSNYDFEKDAANLIPLLSAAGRYALNVGKGLLQTGGKGLKYMGEGAANIMAGGRGGLEVKNVVEPLKNAILNKKVPLTEVTNKWDPFHGIQEIGKVKAVQTEGPLKGMYKYTPTGKDEYSILREALPEGTKANLFQRLKNMPRYMYQQLMGNRPTRGDFVLRDIADKLNKAPGEILAGGDPLITQQLAKINDSFLHFVKTKPWVATKYYGIKGLQLGLLGGLPTYEVAAGLAGKGDPNKTVGENVGRALGSNAALLAGMPLGMVGGYGLYEGGGALGERVGKAISSIGGRPITPEERANQLFGKRRPIVNALPDPRHDLGATAVTAIAANPAMRRTVTQTLNN